MFRSHLQGMNLDKVFFTSDLHFRHSNVLKYTKRPWATVEAMDEVLMANWNDTIPVDGTVFVLGDFWFKGKEEAPELIRMLHGKKHLLLGNHDCHMTPEMLACFESTQHYLEWRPSKEEPTFVMSHYPMVTWNKKGYGSFMLHGHSHGKLDIENLSMRRLDVGVDSTVGEYYPIPYQRVVGVLSARPFQPKVQED